MTMYLNEPDHAGHEAGPDSVQVGLTRITVLGLRALVCLSVCYLVFLNCTQLSGQVSTHTAAG